MKESKPVKLGILGGIRAGKNTVAQIISHELKKRNKKDTTFLALSTGIHDVIKLTMPEVYKEGKPRKELQHIGQSLRELKPDVWIDMLLDSIDCFRAEFLEENIIVTDVRQPNEVKRLQDEGFIIIKVTASLDSRIARAEARGDKFSKEDFYHETEASVSQCPYNYLIDNSHSVDALEQRIVEILEEVI